MNSTFVRRAAALALTFSVALCACGGGGTDGTAEETSGQRLAVREGQAEAAAQTPQVSPVRDFLVMNVCVDEEDRPVPGVPGQCAKHRDIRPDEPVGYHASDWPEADDTRCFAKQGTVHRYSLPLATVTAKQGAVDVLISVVDHGGSEFDQCDATCRCASRAKPARFRIWDSQQDGVSVIARNEEYAHILASKAQDRTSFFLGPACADPNLRGIDRFDPTWIISSSTTPPPGTFGWGQFLSRLSVNELPSPDACTGHRPGFLTWTSGTFGFGPLNDRPLMTLVSEKYAQSAENEPGEARQMERSYWTREFGITRWEKWEREDHLRRDGRTPEEQARRLRAKQVCGRPFGTDSEVTPNLAYGPVLDEALYRRSVRRLVNGLPVEHNWFMVDCADWTNTREQPLFTPSSVWNRSTMESVLRLLEH